MCTMYCPVHRGMTKQQFEAIFERLTPRRREVLLKFLANESDEAIAKSLHITKATVRKTIEKICEQFGLKNDFPDERRSKRQDLVALFAKYKPELLGGCGSVVENEGAIANPNTSVSQGNDLDLDALVEKVRSHPHHRDKIQDQCGSLRILDVEWLVGIDNIYIDVNVLEKLPSNRRLELSDFQHFNPYTDDFDRLGLSKVSDSQVPGLEAVARYSKLMVLGKPGSGKTTFLKFLAIECIRDEFQKERIPIFIELKVFARDAKRKGELSLFNYINQELYTCDISEQQVEKLLHQGRFLLLLDGLDEVKADVDDAVLTEVSEFSRKYFRNEFVITCRIGAQLYNQRSSLGFTDVEIADFGEEQIEAFAKNWFVAVARNSQEKGLSKATQFIEKLQLLENMRIRELAVTPILLNLTCLVFQEKADFPSKRFKLYEQGLDILLERWDESRGIKRDEAYRKLSLEHKKELLSELAFITFNRGDYFFEQDQVQQHIADYLRTLPDAQTEPKALTRDSKVVLKSMEAQHGLLVERAREIYSFSHLTFQEYFTMRKFVESSEPQALKQLVSYVTEIRWHEVFQLATEMIQPANNLLLLMKQYIDALMASDDKLQQYLTWLNQKALSVHAPYKLATVRNFYLELDFGFDPEHELCFDVVHDSYPNLDRAFALDFARDPQGYLNLTDDLALDLYLIRACSQSSMRINGDTIDSSFIDELDHALKFVSEPELEQTLQELKKQIPDSYEQERFQAWGKVDALGWTRQLNDIMVKYRNIGLEWYWKLSNHQKKLIQQYYYGISFLVDCLNSASDNVTPAARQEIEETLLLPIAEIEQWKADNNRTSGR